MKNFTRFMFAMLLALFGSLSSFAYDFEVDGIYYNVISMNDCTCEVTLGSYSGNIIIPSSVEYNGKKFSVTKIGDNAFNRCMNLASVNIPNSVYEIGKNAFSFCYSLKTIEIPNSIKEINDGLFYNCSNLTSFEIPDSVSEIRLSAFSGCTSLTSIEIPDAVTTIEDYAFSGCTGLKSIKIGKSVTSISFKAFNNCSCITSIYFNAVNCTSGWDYDHSLFSGCKSLKEFIFGDCVEVIPQLIFIRNESLTSVVIGNSVTAIGYRAFFECSNLESVVFGKSVKEIGEEAFNRCNRLSTFELPNSLRKIDKYAFCDCPNLTSVVIPDSVTEIGREAFRRTGLELLVIGKSVSKIDLDAFYQCPKIRVVLNKSSLNISRDNVINSKDILKDGDFYFYDSTKKQLVAYAGNDSNVVIPNHVSSIGRNVFINNLKLTSIEVPNSVTEIGSGAFAGCTNLETVNIDDIAAWCKIRFLGYPSTNPLSYAHNLFLNNEIVSNLVIPESVTSISNNAFNGCTSLTSIEIPNSVTNISNDAFLGCTNLRVILNKSALNIVKGSKNNGWVGYNAGLIVKKDVVKDGDFWFKDSSKTQLVAYVKNDENVVIPNSVISIGYNAFDNCSCLLSIVIPSSVTSIGSAAFNRCSNLKEITSLNTTPPTTNGYTFDGVSKIDCVLKVPTESVKAYQAAEEWREFWDIVGIEEVETEGDEPEIEPEIKPEVKICDAPTISIVDGELVVVSSTENTQCHTSITSDDIKDYDGNETISLSGVYNITSYAHAEGYEDSETVTALLVWVKPMAGDNITTDVVSMEAKKAVVIGMNGEDLQISGTERGEKIQLYSSDGMLLYSLTAKDEVTVIPYSLDKGEVYIVKYGDKTVKFNY